MARRVALIAIWSLIAAAAHASPNEDACVLDALASLPQVAGIKIMNIQAKSFSVDSKPRALRFFDVQVDVELAGRSVKYGFNCREEGDQVNIVHRRIIQ